MGWIVTVPAILFWITVFLFLSGLFVCSVYARLEKKRERKRAGIASDGGQENDMYRQLHRSRPAIYWLKPYLYGLCRYYSIIIGRFPSNRIRRFLMKRCFCMEVSQKTVLYAGFEIRSPWNIKIGDSVIGANALLDGRRGIHIQNDVCLSQNVSIFTLQHDVNDAHFGVGGKGGTVEIEKHAWISSNTTILPKIHVGEGAVLASGAVATKDLDPFGIYAGVPAKKISERNRQLEYTVCEGYWHFY